MGRQHKVSGGPTPEIIAYYKKGKEAGLSAEELAGLVNMSTTSFRGYLYTRALPKQHRKTVILVTRLLTKALKKKKLPLSIEFKIGTIQNILTAL